MRFRSMRATFLDEFAHSSYRTSVMCAIAGLTVSVWPNPSTAMHPQVVGWSSQASNLPYPHITVSATGVVPVAPDRATIYFALTTVDSNPRVAASELEAARDRLARAVATLGVQADEITTWGYGAGQRGEMASRMRGPAQPPSIAGQFDARMGVRIVVDSVDLVHPVVAAGLSVGNVAVPAVTFDVRDATEAREEAIAQGVRTAMRDAAALARGAGAELGELLFLTSGQTFDFGNQSIMTLYRGSSGFETPLQPSDVTVRMMVTAAWRVRN